MVSVIGNRDSWRIIFSSVPIVIRPTIVEHDGNIDDRVSD